MKTALLIGGGVIVIGGIAYYLYSKKKAASDQAAMIAQGTSPGVPPSSSPGIPPPQLTPGVSPVAPSVPAAPSIRQTMWKDVDGNIFELTGTKQTWGFVIKVNGSIQAKNNQAEVLVLGPDGHVVSADNNGTLNVYKSGGWTNVIRDNKASVTEYLARLGVRYPTGAFAGFSGLGNAYVLNG